MTKVASTGKTPPAKDYHDRIDQLADKVEKKIIGIRHDLHQNPELPNREFRTAKIIAEHLESLNFDEVRTEVGVTGVVGLLKGGKPGNKVIALRADFDALPIEELADVPFKSTVVDNDYPGDPFPVSHACGHETHAAMLMGAGEIPAETIAFTACFALRAAAIVFEIRMGPPGEFLRIGKPAKYDDFLPSHERIEGAFNELQNTGRNLEHLMRKTVIGLTTHVIAKVTSHTLKLLL